MLVGRPRRLIAAFAVALAVLRADAQHPPHEHRRRHPALALAPRRAAAVDLALPGRPAAPSCCSSSPASASLIHLYSVGYMKADPGYARYFAYLNLVRASCCVLVLGANMPMMFVGWEGVGLCSYLLIGFWFQRRRPTPDAGKKAFIVNRIGDFGFLVGMFLHLRTSARHAQLRRCCRSAGHRSAGRRRARSPLITPVPLPRLHRQDRPRSRSTSGCPTRWPARRRSRR